MKTRWNSYTAYSIACFAIWTALVAYGLITGKTSAQHTGLLVMAGWFLGWASSTIARYVYPPPKKWGALGGSSTGAP